MATRFHDQKMVAATMNDVSVSREEWIATCICGMSEDGTHEDMHEWANDHIDTHAADTTNGTGHRVTVKPQPADR